ncbi:hypothetical protein [Rubricoccus marinus]|uniref:Uncharacterized protein n=1 Tax=Rubricoccus marinus TaxID=716817 RepID=A0A259TUD7_9BACT|nr:hypothetical protein [Rubricoccus marinus]OZC01306.1 hypothetical protein BSZ36_17830 [Rubricoccus marinus]
MPGPGDFCHGCNRLLCRCLPEPDRDAHDEASYQAGYEACLADGYAERPLTEWIYQTGSRAVWDTEAKCLRHHMTPLRFAELTWRHRHASAWAYSRWFERLYGFGLEAYLAGFDDAGAGLPSAVCDERAHARAEAALDAYGPVPEPDPEPVQPSTEAVEVDDWMPF